MRIFATTFKNLAVLSATKMKQIRCKDYLTRGLFDKMTAKIIWSVY